MPEKMPRTKKAKRAAVKQTMDEWKQGTLHSGSKTGPKVTSQKQAVAIALKQSGQSKPPRGRKGRSTPRKRSMSGAKKPKRSSPKKSSARRKRLESVTF